MHAFKNNREKGLYSAVFLPSSFGDLKKSSPSTRFSYIHKGAVTLYGCGLINFNFSLRVHTTRINTINTPSILQVFGWMNHRRKLLCTVSHIVLEEARGCSVSVPCRRNGGIIVTRHLPVSGVSSGGAPVQSRRVRSLWPFIVCMIHACRK